MQRKKKPPLDGLDDGGFFLRRLGNSLSLYFNSNGRVRIATCCRLLPHLLPTSVCTALHATMLSTCNLNTLTNIYCTLTAHLSAHKPNVLLIRVSAVALFSRHKKTRYLERVLYTSTGGVLVIYGARSRNRTGTVLPPRDFKSLASTYSAIRAVEA